MLALDRHDIWFRSKFVILAQSSYDYKVLEVFEVN